MKFLGIFLVLFLYCFNVVFATGFSDVQGHVYQDAILDLGEMGVIKGYEDGSFRADDLVNRAEMMKIVFGALGEEVDEGLGNCFLDVGEEWFAPYVCLAKNRKVVGGYEDGNFRPDWDVSMVEVLKMAILAFDLPVREVLDDEAWYESYVDFAHENNIFSKYSYWPSAKVSRGKVAFLVRSLMEIVEEKNYVDARRFSGSSACGSVWPFDPPNRFLVDGKERSVIVSVPDSYDENVPVPVVFGFHGRTNPNYQVRSYYGIEGVFKNEAIFVYPAGVQKGDSYTWSDGGDGAGDLRDYLFFDVMLKELSAMYCLDLDKVYAVGHSLGGWFANSLACARGDVIRAVVSVGSGRSNSVCSGPTAVMQWHNPNDRLASFASGKSAKNSALDQNMCSSDFVSSLPLWGSCVRYLGCNDFAPVVWCPHTNDYDARGNYYPHNWPKGIGAEIWKFFKGLE